MQKELLASLGVLAGLGIGVGAYAQTGTTGNAATTATNDDQLQEVVVTAEKRSEDLQKVAESIQVTSGEELVKEGKKRLDEIMQGVVGVQSQDSQVGAAFSIRGVDTGVGGPPGTNPGATVAVYVDGNYQNRGEVVRGATLDVSQAEVMRGTQSTTLGASAIAGAVSLVTNQPAFNYQAQGTLEIGDYNTKNMDAVLNAPLGDTQALRFAYSSDRRDGYLSSNAGNVDNQVFRLKYRWQPTESLNLVATVEHNSIGGNGVTAGVLLYSGSWQPYKAANASSYTTLMGYPPLFGYVPSNITFRDRSDPWNDGYPANDWPNNPYRDTQITSYSIKADWTTDLGTLTFVPNIQNAHFRSVEPPRAGSYRSENSPQNTTQMDLRFASPSSSPFEWLLGAYYYYTNVTDQILSESDPGVAGAPGAAACPSTGSPPVQCYSWSENALGSTQTESVYGNLTYPIIPTLRVIAGLRYSHDHLETQTSNGVVDPAITETLESPGSAYTLNPIASASYSNIAYRAGLEYDVLPQSMAYLTYATGYQPGTPVCNGPPGGACTPGTPSAKNTSDQWTLGLKNRFFNDKLQLNLEAFMLKFLNRPFNDPISITETGSTDNCNAAPGTTATVIGATMSCLAPSATGVVMPNQKSQGLDFDASWVPTSHDRLDLAFEYLNSTYGSNPTAPNYSATDLCNLYAAQYGTACPGGASGTAAQTLASNYQTLINSYKGVILQNSPRFSGNLTLQHMFQLGKAGQFSPRINIQYKDTYWAQGGGPAPSGYTSAKYALTPGSIVRQDAYELYDFYAPWSSADGKFTVTGYIKNIANKAILTNISGGGGGPNYVSLNDPRTFGVIFQAAW